MARRKIGHFTERGGRECLRIREDGALLVALNLGPRRHLRFPASAPARTQLLHRSTRNLASIVHPFIIYATGGCALTPPPQSGVPGHPVAMPSRRGASSTRTGPSGITSAASSSARVRVIQHGLPRQDPRLVRSMPGWHRMALGGFFDHQTNTTSPRRWPKLCSKVEIPKVYLQGRLGILKLQRLLLVGFLHCKSKIFPRHCVGHSGKSTVTVNFNLVGFRRRFSLCGGAEGRPRHL